MLNDTQGNYATQDSTGMWHLMPWWHLTEWRQKEEWYMGICTLWQFKSKLCYYIWVCHRKCHLSLYSDFMLVQLTVAGIVLPRPFVQISTPPLTTVANATVASSGTCHCYPEWQWHNFPMCASYTYEWVDPVDLKYTQSKSLKVNAYVW